VHQQIVGDPIRTDVKTLYIDDLCVDESTRGMGVGRALFDHVVAYARQSGCHDVTLNVWELNRGARAFYERMGMHPLKTCMETVL
jgi:ribosomal protein S18 acetylase RimI-like enzyme